MFHPSEMLLPEIQRMWAPRLPMNIRQCDGLVEYDVILDVQRTYLRRTGPGVSLFDGGFGLVALGGIKKPSYSAFALLHKLGPGAGGRGIGPI